MEENKKVNADFYFKLYQGQLTQIRHYETQRSTIVTTIIGISGAIIGLITYDSKILKSDLYLASFLIFIGVFGTGFLFQHSRRLKKHIEITNKYRQVLDRLITVPESTDKTGNEEFEIEHNQWISMRRWWIGISIAIILIGCIIIGQIFNL